MRAVEASHALYRRMAEEFGCAFVGGFLYFERLHEFGEYFLTALKGNMVNHPYGNVDPDWGRFDEALVRPNPSLALAHTRRPGDGEA